MIPYLLLAFAPPAISYVFCSRERDRKTRIFLSTLMFFVGFLLLVSCRHLDIGTDNDNYKIIFEGLQDLKWQKIAESWEIEVGYSWLNVLVGQISQDYQTFVAIVAIISIVPIAIMYVKESESSFLTLVLLLNVGIFAMYFSGLRQVIAMAFVVPAYYLTKNKRLVLFVLTVLIATLFHQSALVMLIFYPVYHSRITTKKFMVIVPIVLLSYIFNSAIFTFLVRIMGEKYEERYGALETTGAVMMIILFALFVVYSYFIVDEGKLDSDSEGLRNILIICLILQLFSPVNSVAMRMNYYFLPFVPIAIPKMANRSKDHFSSLAWLSVFIMGVFFALRFVLNMYTSVDVLQIFPYKFFWQ